MRRLLGIAAAAAIAFSMMPADAKSGGSRSSSGYHYVKPHVTKNGAYVKGHNQTNPNKTKRDNWSTKGNVNPFTGRAGTKNPN